MEKQLINEAKRLQQLAGIKEMQIHTPVNPRFRGDEVWFFSTPGRPNEEVIDTYLGIDEDGEDIEWGNFEFDEDNPDNQYYTKGEYWNENGDMITGRNYWQSRGARLLDDGRWAIYDYADGNEVVIVGLKEGQDFVLVSKDLIDLINKAYGAPDYAPEADKFTEYLQQNNWTVNTNSDEWKKAVELFGNEGRLKSFMNYLKVKIK